MFGRGLRAPTRALRPAAITRAPESPPSLGPASVFAVVAPASGTSLLTTKASMTAFSDAVEQECLQGPDGLARAHVFGAFQHGRFHEPARERWERLAAASTSVHVFADFADGAAPVGPTRVALADDHPLRREWAIVVDRPQGPVAVSALERPGQDDVPERHRRYDSTWTTSPAVVRRAAAVCAGVAGAHGIAGSEALVTELRAPARAGVDTAVGERLLDRLLVLLEA